MSERWQDPYEQDETRARQEMAHLEDWRQRSDQEQRLINVSLIGFNLGLCAYNLSCYLANESWGYLVGALIHLCTGVYVLRQCVRLYRKAR